MPSKIDEIGFGIFSPQQIKDMAVVEINKPELYDKSGYPAEGGVMDPRMGVIDPGMKCRTCGGSIGTCQGHFGYIDLSRPVIHVRYVKTVYKLLRATCEECHEPLGDDEEIEEMEDPLYELYLKKRSKCPHCGADQGKVKRQRPHNFTISGNQINPMEIREWFEGISDETVEKFGLKGGRPEWLILTLLPVPPVTMRPSITLESSERSEDDLTHKLVDLIRINQRLSDNIQIGAPDFIIDDLWELLQYHVSTFFDNNLSGVPQARHRSGRALKTLAQRLKSKEGRFRGNLAGKRVDFSARTVISPDPNISINEVGVPREIAKEITIPVKVRDENLSKLKSWVRNGPENWIGANYLRRPDGGKKKITQENCKQIAEELEEGFTVERHLKDGDVILFNRQPSLHRMSLMAHRVRVMPWRTFRLNLCVCAPYNADFDGDEMNLHAPQTEEARAEAEELMLVQENLRSPRFGGPIIGCTQDHVSGLFLLSQDGVEFTRKEAQELLAQSGLEKEIEKDRLTGKELFSQFLPDINLRFEPEAGAEEVIIENGELKQGRLDEEGLGSFQGKILEKIERKHGSDEARKFLNRISRLSLEYLDRRGFTIGISDVDISEGAESEIEEMVVDAEEEAKDMIKSFEEGEIEQLPGQTSEESLETHIKRRLNTTKADVEGVVSNDLSQKSPAVMMAESGARGGMTALATIAGVVGQQTLEGERIHRGYKDRTLSLFERGELSPEAHGFVRSSFKEGLSPEEFYFLVMNGREGLMDTSLRTRKSGYMERRLVNALQDLKVESDGTVRDNRKIIVQFTPGEDGIDPAKSKEGEVPVDMKN
ncbi:DNA-directed RNA polymerase subunit A' [candidate division MSBL1 archaeon SCGC-AAA382A20]|uniref:DNA-directed RNA polymerase subunit Rpo1N n=1 Tax=candidate division MSBL1 archaeon SCGC-AAA382A20 TaxID=1698280 RepID=A0A133VIR0_9EURY|nr:DNA-directed RNA polymerase subunit A' [candidate division MSBL1 archaeon SCGC-AAA382A20]